MTWCFLTATDGFILIQLKVLKLILMEQIETTEDLSFMLELTLLLLLMKMDVKLQKSIEITESGAITITETTSDYNGFGVSCNGATDGSIDITVEGRD